MYRSVKQIRNGRILDNNKKNAFLIGFVRNIQNLYMKMQINLYKLVIEQAIDFIKTGGI